MQAGRHGSSAPRSPWATFYPPRGVGVGKAASSFSGVAAPPWYPGRGVFKSAEGRSSNPCPWSEPECTPHSLPPQRPEAILELPLAKPACLVLMAFLSNLLTCGGLPLTPEFPLCPWSFIGTSATTCANSMLSITQPTSHNTYIYI